MAETFEAWLNDLKKSRWHVTLYQALLGSPLAYFGYRFRYLLLNHFLTTGLHLFEFYLLGFYFNTQQFFGLILLRASTLIIKNAWWGALEGLRERVRRQMFLLQINLIPEEITCWVYLALLIGTFSFLGGILLLWYFFHQTVPKTSERFVFYGLAMLVQLFADILTRVIHSGVFATQRIYRPWWSIPLSEILALLMILILLPTARLWCLPASYIVFSISALYLTWHYAYAAYHLQNRKILTIISWAHLKTWCNQLPVKKILLAAMASVVMSLEGVILWLFQPLATTDPLLFKLLYLLSPQVSAGFDWARMCYFDLKKLASPQWAILTRRFFHYSFLLSILMGMVFWVLGAITARFFLPLISFSTLCYFLPLFIGRSLLAYRQIQLFARNDYVDVIVSMLFLVAAVLAGHFFIPRVTLFFLFLATYLALIFSMRSHFPATPILAEVKFTPIYSHLTQLKLLNHPVNLVYMEIAKNLSAEKRQDFLEQISALLKKNLFSAITGRVLLCSVFEPKVLSQIKQRALGCVEYFQETGWQRNGKAVLQQAYFLKKKIYNFNESFPSLHPEQIRRNFLKDFPEGMVVDMDQLAQAKLENKMRSTQESAQLAQAIAKAWLSVNQRVHLGGYFTLIYWGEKQQMLLMARCSKSLLHSMKRWQRQLWQFYVAQLCQTGDKTFLIT